MLRGKGVWSLACWFWYYLTRTCTNLLYREPGLLALPRERVGGGLVLLLPHTYLHQSAVYGTWHVGANTWEGGRRAGTDTTSHILAPICCTGNLACWGNHMRGREEGWYWYYLTHTCTNLLYREPGMLALPKIPPPPPPPGIKMAWGGKNIIKTTPTKKEKKKESTREKKRKVTKWQNKNNVS